MLYNILGSSLDWCPDSIGYITTVDTEDIRSLLKLTVTAQIGTKVSPRLYSETITGTGYKDIEFLVENQGMNVYCILPENDSLVYAYAPSVGLFPIVFIAVPIK